MVCLMFCIGGGVTLHWAGRLGLQDPAFLFDHVCFGPLFTTFYDKAQPSVLSHKH